MQADVLPVPTAPRIMTPVYKPRCGIVSHVGAGARPGVVGKWASPSTSTGAGRCSGAGYGGSAWDRTVGRRRDSTIAIDRQQRGDGEERRAEPQGRVPIGQHVEYEWFAHEDHLQEEVILQAHGKRVQSPGPDGDRDGHRQHRAHLDDGMQHGSHLRLRALGCGCPGDRSV